MIKHVVLAGFVLVVLSCGQRQAAPPGQKSLFDSGLDAHLARVSSLPFYDTESHDYRILRALQRRDALAFRKEIGLTAAEQQVPALRAAMDSCLPRLPQNVSEEAYCFEYYYSFSSVNTRAFIEKTRSGATLLVTYYQFAWDTMPCRIHSEQRIMIDSTAWLEFSEMLRSADIWGLRSDNGHYGLDGSSLKVWAWKSSADATFDGGKKTRYIYRWGPENLGLMQPFYWLLKKAGLKMACNDLGF